MVDNVDQVERPSGAGWPHPLNNMGVREIELIMKRAIVKIDQLRINIPYNHIMDLASKNENLPFEVLIADYFFRLTTIFHEPNQGNAHNGYTNCYIFGSDTGAISVMWNDNRPDMGISIDFTATGKALYEELGSWLSLKINWKEIITIICKKYNGHLSRIDVAVDLIDCEFSVNSIYKRLQEEKSYFLNTLGNRINAKRYKAIGSAQEAQTLYVGSRRSDAFLRIYNKKLEQMRPNGIYRNIAYNCKDWIRVEGEFKHRLSKDLGYRIANLGDEDIKPFLVAYLVNRWALVDVRDHEEK